MEVTIMKKNNKGFTLVELIVVLVILAILAAILIPALLGYIDKAKEQKILIDAEYFYKAAQATASEYYGISIKTEPENGNEKNTEENGYWISVTNQYKSVKKAGQERSYFAHCMKLMDSENMPAYYAVAVVDASRKGKISYVTYYDVESGKCAYWNYIDQTWTIKDNIPKPTESSWGYVLCSAGYRSEKFGTYYSL